MYDVVLYETESGRCPIQEYLEELTKNNKQNELTQIFAFVRLLENHGMAVNNIRHETIRPLRDDIYELRPGKNRLFFFYYTGNKFVLLHAYRKSKGEAPPREIRQAKREKDDYIRRNKK